MVEDRAHRVVWCRNLLPAGSIEFGLRLGRVRSWTTARTRRRATARRFVPRSADPLGVAFIRCAATAGISHPAAVCVAAAWCPLPYVARRLRAASLLAELGGRVTARVLGEARAVQASGRRTNPTSLQQCGKLCHLKQSCGEAVKGGG
eukprot:COSAG02_NODE_611_length_19555_cov_34.449270_14_plen_148_part_00